MILLFAFLVPAILAVNDEKQAAETVILVSMDGLRWQYIDEGFASTPNLDYIARQGVSAKYIKTVVPTKTWPNHQTFLTGLYPENHGMVANTFWDPVYQEKFVLDYDCANYDPKFYNASEPIWLTLQKGGGRSALYFWPGFGGCLQKPTFYEKPAICPVNCRPRSVRVRKTCVLGLEHGPSGRTQDLGHSFSQYGPPGRQITYI